MRAIGRAFQVLRILALGGERGVRLTDVVAYSGLSHPTVHRILQTLISEGVGEQDVATRRYRVGPEISLLGLSRPANFPVRTAAEPYLAALANEIGDTTFLTIRAGWDSVAIERKTGSYPIKVLAIDVGTRRPLGVSIAGVMLLASMPREEADHICDMNAARLPPDGPSMDIIRARVEAARRDGYAYSEEGVLHGTRALSVPVFDEDGKTVAVIAVAAMAERLAELELPRIVKAMRTKAALITKRLTEMQRAGRRRSG
ncbi:IclR family transcriptional regulator [Burkholderia pseudomultivorans]|uniref:IclR family transcriptional regulator n=1 Tax=Burkholderia pseudomultivorans TaxID=1207504 RepID=UPI000A76D63B|nr:IclR family transcriptional regulator [Burkholderia pseudomultivorans]MDS0856244.1 IclR family transcriptional regulator [Burkholderia pseudomultivorans]